MKVLFDQGTPVPLRVHLKPHTVETAAERGWSRLRNGELLQRATAAGYDVFVTTDQGLQHQQKLSRLPFGIVVLTSTSWPRVQKKTDAILEAVRTATPGEAIIVDI